jgi:hypothetical protein
VSDMEPTNEAPGEAAIGQDEDKRTAQVLVETRNAKSRATRSRVPTAVWANMAKGVLRAHIPRGFIDLEHPLS